MVLVEAFRNPSPAYRTNFNFTVDYSGKTNAPVVQLTMPWDGMQVAGTNFTLRGQVDDPTVTVFSTITDTNGNTNMASGIVERVGRFWVEDLPLNSGTNYVSIIVSNVVGNFTVTNISIVQGSLTLTMTPLLDDTQLWQPTADLTGSISDTTYAVWVNGVAGVNNGDGTWGAANVPVTPGGVAIFDMTAYPPSEAPAGSSTATGVNPQTAHAQNASVNPDKPAEIYVANNSYTTHTVFNWNSTTTYPDGSGCTFTRMYDITDGAKWYNGIGGSGSRIEDYVQHDDCDDGEANPNQEIHDQRTSTWPASFWPNLADGSCAGINVNNLFDGTGPITNGFTYTVPVPPMDYVHCKKTVDYEDPIAYLDNGGGMTVGSMPEVYTEKRDLTLMLRTGGKNESQKSHLFCLSAAVRRLQLQIWAGTMMSVTDVGPVTPTSIKLDGQSLGSDSNLWVMLPDNKDDIDITPRVQNEDYYSYNSVNQQKYKLTINANSTPLAEDKVLPEANFCVGQDVSFSLSGLPAGVTATNFQWTLGGTFVNETNQANANSSVNYTHDPVLLQNAVITNCWWVTGGFNPPATYAASVTCTLLFTNGNAPQKIQGYGLFSMYRPSIVFFTNGPPAYATNIIVAGTPYLSLGDGNSHGDMQFTVWILSKFDGRTDFTQLINRYAYNGSLLSTKTTHGAYYLDNFVYYLNGVNNPNNSYSVTAGVINKRLIFSDSPQMQEYSSLLGGSTTSIIDTFKDYVMFRPNSGNPNSNIYVVLGMTSWGWSASSTYSGGSWSVPTAPTPTSPSGFDNSNNFPSWPQIYLNDN